MPAIVLWAIAAVFATFGVTWLRVNPCNKA
jgi:hypothetical protein